MKTKFKIGSYNPDGTKKIKTKPIKKRMKHNRTYRGSLTKHNKRSREKRILIYLTVGFILLASNVFINISNDYTINAEMVKGTRPTNELSHVVEQVVMAEDKISAPLPVMVETEKSNEEKIREIAEEYNFRWTDWLIRLAKCENRTLDTKAINDKGNTPAGSIDRGIFQINDFWHSEVSNECAYDLRCSTIWTMQRVNAGYQSEWVCNNKI